MPVAVITDSAASLGAEVSERLHIVTVPMQLEIGGVPVSEADMAMDELVARLDDGVRTSSPPPGALVEAIESTDAADGVVLLTVGSQLSATYQSALTAASLASKPGLVRVVDTGTAAGAQGLVAIAAAEAAASGAGLDEVEERSRFVAARVRLVASVEKLTYLVRGGRLPASAARAATHLGVRILFELSRARIRPLRPSFSADGALDQILGIWRRSATGDDALHVAALHALREHDAQTLLSKVTAEKEAATSFVGTFGPVMVAHTGPGVIGLAWWWEPTRAGSSAT